MLLGIATDRTTRNDLLAAVQISFYLGTGEDVSLGQLERELWTLCASPEALDEQWLCDGEG